MYTRDTYWSVLYMRVDCESNFYYETMNKTCMFSLYFVALSSIFGNFISNNYVYQPNNIKESRNENMSSEWPSELFLILSVGNKVSHC